MKKAYKALALLGVASLPVVVAAQTTATTVLDTISKVLNTVFPLIVLLIVLAFAWGIFKFVTAAGDEEARKTGRSFMLWSVIGLFVLVAVWGLVNLLLNTFSLDTQAPQLPAIPCPQGQSFDQSQGKCV